MQSGLHTVTVLKLRNFFNYFETQQQVENVLHPKFDTFFVSKGSLTRHMNTYKENPTCGKSKKILSKRHQYIWASIFPPTNYFLIVNCILLMTIKLLLKVQALHKNVVADFFATQNALNQHEKKNRENETCTRSKKYYATPIRLEKMENIFPEKTA